MWLLTPIRYCVDALTEEATPRQMAAAIALGAIVGLVPKDNLTAIVLMTLLCLLRINLAAGLMSAFAFSWVGVISDPLTHQLGHWLLTRNALAPFWGSLAEMPVMLWTDFNNTIVLGSFVLGVLLFLPLYRGTQPLVVRYVPVLVARLQRFRVVRLLTGAELVDRLGRV